MLPMSQNIYIEHLYLQKFIFSHPLSKQLILTSSLMIKLGRRESSKTEPRRLDGPEPDVGN